MDSRIITHYFILQSDSFLKPIFFNRPITGFESEEKDLEEICEEDFEKLFSNSFNFGLMATYLRLTHLRTDNLSQYDDFDRDVKRLLFFRFVVRKHLD